MIDVIATVTLQAGTRSRFLQEFAAVQGEVLREAGCLDYRAAVDEPSGLGPQIPIRPDVVTIIERWQDVAALRAHSTAPHMVAYRARVAAVVESTSLQVLSAAS